MAVNGLIGKIVDVEKIKSKNYLDETYYNFWEVIPPITDTRAQSGGNSFILKNDELILKTIKSAEKILCIITPELTHEDIINELVRLANAGVRIYIILGYNRGTLMEDREIKSHLRNIAGLTLIRLSSKINWTIILPDPGTQKKGIFSNMPLKFFKEISPKLNKIIIPLNRNQKKELFLLFKNLFWTQAGYEILNNYDVDTPQKIPDQPIVDKENYSLQDTKSFYLVADTSSLKEKILENIAIAKSNLKIMMEHIFMDDEFFTEIVKKFEELIAASKMPSTLLINRDGFFLDVLKKNPISRDNNILSSFDSEFVSPPFTFFIIDDKNALIAFDFLSVIEDIGDDSDSHTFKKYIILLNLNKTQTNALLTIFRNNLAHYNLKFFSKKTMKDIKGKIYLAETNEEITIDTKEGEFTKELPPLEAESLEEFLELIKKTDRDDIKKYRVKHKAHVQYKWKVRPPRLDSNNKKVDLDPIYDEWSLLEEKFNANSEKLKNTISKHLKEIEQYLGDPNKEILKKQLLAEQLELKKLEKEIFNIDFESEPYESIRDKIVKFDNLLDGFTALDSRIKNYYRNEKIILDKRRSIKNLKEDIDRNNNKIESLKKSVDDKRLDADKNEDEIRELEIKIEEIKNKKDSKKKEDKKKDSKKKEDKKKDSKKKEDKKKEDKKKDKDLLKKLQKELENKRIFLKKIKDEIRTLRDKIDDLNENNDEKNRKIAEIQKEIKQIENSLGKDPDKILNQNDSALMSIMNLEVKHSGNKKHKKHKYKSGSEDSAPLFEKLIDYLPKIKPPPIGKLYVYKNKRFLGITTYQDYFSAIEEKISDTYNAKIVVLSES